MCPRCRPSSHPASSRATDTSNSHSPASLDVMDEFEELRVDFAVLPGVDLGLWLKMVIALVLVAVVFTACVMAI